MSSQTTPNQVNDPIINEVRKLISSPAIPSNAISSFIATQNAASGGVDVSFHVSVSTGISSISLLRSSVMDYAQATVLQTWSAIDLLDYAFPDAANIASVTKAYYYLRLNPTGTSGTSALYGPQVVALNPDLSSPTAPTSLTVSHDAVSNGTIQMYLNVGGVTVGNSIRVFVSGYHANPSPVAVTQAGSSPITFALDATGEIVTIQVAQVTPQGIQSGLSPAVTLTLSSARTVPASPVTPTVVQFSGGNQVTWRSSAEPWVLSYYVFRGQRDETFLTATNIATVTATAEGTVTYLDTAGLTGDFAYYIVAHSATGDSAPSGPGFSAITYTSSSIPPNVPGNTTNNATIDSIDSGTNAIVRIYGPGGPGTSYVHYTGYGSLNRPNGVVVGLPYNTAIFVMYDTIAKAYFIYPQSTGYPGTLPDRYEYVGLALTLTTTGAHGSGAIAVAGVSAGAVTSVVPTANGSGYIPGSVTVSISGGGGGSGAAATANVSGVSNGVTSYTITNGGTGYTSAPTVVVTGNAGTGSTGGGGTTGGDSGYRGGCVEEGTPVDVPHGTISILEDCEEWVEIRLGPSGDPVLMHPDTMVGVWKKAKELTAWSRINVADEFGYSKWKRPDSIKHITKKSKKVKRICPGGVYRAGKEKILLHNVKYLSA